MRLPFLAKLSVLTSLLIFSTHAFSQSEEMTTNSENSKSSMQSTSDITPKDDAAITKTLKELIAKSETLSKLNIHVSSHEGVVTLKGTTDSETQITTLVENAESIIGVKDVNISELNSKDGKQPLADSLITAKIKGLFIREKLFGEKDIAAINTSVETKDGIVYLSGLVDNKEQINNAVEIIKKSIPEVKKVEYSIKVAPASSN